MNQRILLIAYLTLCSHVFAKKVSIGGNGGYLNYPNTATALSVVPGDTIAIKPGTYSGFSFSNLHGNAVKKIVIINDKGLVEVTGSSSLNNLNNVTLTGTGTPTLAQGFYFHDIANRGIELGGNLDSITISYCRFENIADYTIRINADMVYNGSANTLLTHLKFLHLSFKKVTSPIDWGNYAYAADLIGMGKDVEIAYCNVDSLNGGDGFRLNKVFEANVHHNHMTNTGLQLSSTHPGTVFIRGNGQFHHNFFANLWGNGVRSEGVGLNGVGNLYIYDNIFLGSRKYSAIETQTIAGELTGGTTIPFTAPCNYYVYYNTMGNQSARDFSARMVDVYDLSGGTCQIRNNLGFNIEKDKAYIPTQSYVFNREAANLPDTSNNLYSHSYLDLGLEDTLNCYLKSSSIAIDKGSVFAFVTDDYEGISRPQGNKPDIGAREYTVVTVLTDVIQESDIEELYPNPATQTLQVKAHTAIQQLILRNANGQTKTIYTNLNLQEISIDIEALPKGLYTITIQEAGKTYTQSFVKE